VCQELQRTANRHILKKLALFPSGLDALYTRIIQQMSESDNAEICRCVLASTTVLYRLVTTRELVALIEQLNEVSNNVQEIVSLCGSFLTIRDDTVYFMHQSAKTSSSKKRHLRSFQTVLKKLIRLSIQRR
jgi:hypothetical protein